MRNIEDSKALGVSAVAACMALQKADYQYKYQGKHHTTRFIQVAERLVRQCGIRPDDNE